MIWPIVIGLAAASLLISFAPAEWWGRFHGKPIPAEWDAIEQHDGMKYEAYLLSDAWQQRRRFLIARADHRCMTCNSRGVLQLHHRIYERVGDERIEDLIVLCKPCHEMFHIVTRGDGSSPVMTERERAIQKLAVGLFPKSFSSPEEQEHYEMRQRWKAGVSPEEPRRLAERAAVLKQQLQDRGR